MTTWRTYVPPVSSDMVELTALVREWYRLPRGGTGGPLHVYLDDQNVDDCFIAGYLSDPETAWCGYAEIDTPENRALAERIMRQLGAMPKPSRKATLTHANMYNYDGSDHADFDW